MCVAVCYCANVLFVCFHVLCLGRVIIVQSFKKRFVVSCGVLFSLLLLCFWGDLGLCIIPQTG